MGIRSKGALWLWDTPGEPTASVLGAMESGTRWGKTGRNEGQSLRTAHSSNPRLARPGRCQNGSAPDSPGHRAQVQGRQGWALPPPRSGFSKSGCCFHPGGDHACVCTCAGVFEASGGRKAWGMAFPSPRAGVYVSPQGRAALTAQPHGHREARCSLTTGRRPHTLHKWAYVGVNVHTLTRRRTHTHTRTHAGRKGSCRSRHPGRRRSKHTLAVSWAPERSGQVPAPRAAC